jgi:hypothetical protein
MKYAVEMGSGAVSIHKNFFSHSKANGGGGNSQTYGQHGGRISSCLGESCSQS